MRDGADNKAEGKDSDAMWLDRLEREMTYMNIHERYVRRDGSLWVLRSYSYPRVKDIKLGITGPQALEALTRFKWVR